MSQNLLDDRGSLVKISAGQQPVERATEAVDVTASVSIMRIGRLLGRHVIHRAHDSASVRELMIGRIARRIEPGQAHVENLHDAFAIEQQVGWFNVSMHHAFVVGIGQATSSLQDTIDSVRHGSGPRSLTIAERSRPSTYSMTR